MEHTFKLQNKTKKITKGLQNLSKLRAALRIDILGIARLGGNAPRKGWTEFSLSSSHTLQQHRPMRSALPHSGMHTEKK